MLPPCSNSKAWKISIDKRNLRDQCSSLLYGASKAQLQDDSERSYVEVYNTDPWANSYHSFSSVLHVPIVFSFPIFSVSLSQCCSLSVERWRGMEDGRKRSDLSVCQDWHQREREIVCACVWVRVCACVCVWVLVCACALRAREREREKEMGWDGHEKVEIPTEK